MKKLICVLLSFFLLMILLSTSVSATNDHLETEESSSVIAEEETDQLEQNEEGGKLVLRVLESDNSKSGGIELVAVNCQELHEIDLQITANNGVVIKNIKTSNDICEASMIGYVFSSCYTKSSSMYTGYFKDSLPNEETFNNEIYPQFGGILKTLNPKSFVLGNAVIGSPTKATPFMFSVRGTLWGRETTVVNESILVRANAKVGDLDCDDEITAADARLALRGVVGLENYAEFSRNYYAADADLNDELTAADARRILRVAVGLEELKV